ncbi:unnamed protein product, partial [Chrysoparadoxa australica]
STPAGGTSCLSCAVGYFGLDGVTCHVCPAGALCQEEGVILPEAMEDFFRLEPNSTALDASNSFEYGFHRCVADGVCLGGADSLCVEGHKNKSPKCAVCDTGYYLTPALTCSVCPPAANVSAGITLAFIGIILGLLFFLWLTLKYSAHKAKGAAKKEEESLRRRLRASITRRLSGVSGRRRSSSKSDPRVIPVDADHKKYEEKKNKEKKGSAAHVGLQGLGNQEVLNQQYDFITQGTGVGTAPSSPNAPGDNTIQHNEEQEAFDGTNKADEIDVPPSLAGDSKDGKGESDGEEEDAGGDGGD